MKKLANSHELLNDREVEALVTQRFNRYGKMQAMINKNFALNIYQTIQALCSADKKHPE